MERVGEVWQQRPDWAAGRVDSEVGGRGPIIGLWLFTIVWNVGSWLAAIAAAQGKATGHTELAPIFPAVGLGILALAVYVTLQQRKWGRSRLELLTLPAVLGGPLRCILHASPRLAEAEELAVSIDCRGTESEAGTVQLIKHLWHHELRVPRADFELDGETRVPLAFRLPYGLPESNPRQAGDDATWVLRARASVPGVDYQAHFDLPVFRTSESSSDEEGSRMDVPSLAQSPGSDEPSPLADSKIRVRPWGTGGLELVFGMLRNPWLGLLCVGITLFFSGLLAMIVYADGPGFFALVFGLATLFLAWASVDTLFGITRVQVERGRLRVRAGLFGIGPLRTLQLHEIERIRVVPEAQYGSDLLCRIRIERRARGPGESARRRRVTAGTRIPSQAEAETLARAMREGVGLPSPG